MSDIIINSKYAPGLSTYGVQGNEGKQGKQGYGLYFVPFDIRANQKNVINSINENYYITDNTYKNVEKMLNRTYQAGDTLLSCTGEIWQITNIADGTNDTSINCLRKIARADDLFEKAENYIIPKNCEKLVLNDNDDNFKDEDIISLLNIYCNNSANIIAIKNDNDNLNLAHSNNNYYVTTNTALNVYNLYVRYVPTETPPDTNYKKILTTDIIDISVNDTSIILNKLNKNDDYNIIHQYIEDNVYKYEIINIDKDKDKDSINVTSKGEKSKLIISPKNDYISKCIFFDGTINISINIKNNTNTNSQ